MVVILPGAENARLETLEAAQIRVSGEPLHILSVVEEIVRAGHLRWGRPQLIQRLVAVLPLRVIWFTGFNLRVASAQSLA
jgi:hypothetical protein